MLNPDWCFDLPDKDAEFGHGLHKYFMLDNYVNVNCASYGVSPNYVVKARKRYMEEIEKNPDLHFRTKHKKMLEERRNLVAEYMNADPEGIVFTFNVPEGMNTLLRSLKYEKGDKIFHFSVSYPSTKMVINHVMEKFGLDQIIMPMTKDIIDSDEKILERIEEYVDKYGDQIRVAVIEHIIFMPTVVLPAKAMVKIFREKGIPCIVDGAHGFGTIDLNIKDIDHDFYITTVHKWSYVPKSVGVVYVRKEFRDQVHPSCIVLEPGRGFQEEFSYVGTRDYTSIYAIKEALEFRNLFGDKKIKEYCKKTVIEGAKRAAEIWGTKLLITDENRLTTMCCVKYPIQDRAVMEKYNELGLAMLNNHKTYPVFVEYEGVCYIRFSAQIYNEVRDYEYHALATLNHIKDLKNSGQLQ